MVFPRTEVIFRFVWILKFLCSRGNTSSSKSKLAIENIKVFPYYLQTRRIICIIILLWENFALAFTVESYWHEYFCKETAWWHCPCFIAIHATTAPFSYPPDALVSWEQIASLLRAAGAGEVAVFLCCNEHSGRISSPRVLYSPAKHRVHTTYIFPLFMLVRTRLGFNTTLKCIPPAQGVRFRAPHCIPIK